MKTMLGILMVVCFVLVANVMADNVVRSATPQEIAEKPELIVDAIKNQNAEKSADMVVKALAVILATDWDEARKRENITLLITYAVATKGKEAAPMMGLVAGRIPQASLSVVAATAVIAAGDNSPAVANAIVAAAGNNVQAADISRAACANPSTILSPAEIGVVRGVTLPTPTQAPAKAPPLPTIIVKGAGKYPGQ